MEKLKNKAVVVGVSIIFCVLLIVQTSWVCAEPVSYYVHFDSVETLTGDDFALIGDVVVDGVSYDIWDAGGVSLQLAEGDHSAEYIPNMGFDFVRWVPSGAVSVDSIYSQSTTMTVSGSGGLRARFKRNIDLEAVSQTAAVTEVTQGDIVEIDVTVKNNGDYQGSLGSSFVNCYANNIEIDSQNVFFPDPRNSMVVTFIWDTTNWPLDEYSITAWADAGDYIGVEIDEDNNWCTMPLDITIVELQTSPPICSLIFLVAIVIVIIIILIYLRRRARAQQTST